MHYMQGEIRKGEVIVADIGAGKFGRVRNSCSETKCQRGAHAENCNDF